MIKIDGTPILFPTPDLVDFVERWQEQEQLPTRRVQIEARDNVPSGDCIPIPMVTPSWPERPAPRINQLYWPTGATRWAEGYFLIGPNIYSSLVAQGETLATPKPIVVQVTDSMGGPDLEYNMIALTPKQITARTAAQSATGVWVLPVVCKRWLWNQKLCESSPITPGMTWDALLTAMFAKVGTTGTWPTVHSDYMKPDFESFNRSDATLAVMIDAAVFSLGMRLVFDIDETVILDSAANISNSHTTRFDGIPRIAGESEACTPLEVNVQARKRCDFQPTQVLTNSQGNDGVTILTTCWEEEVTGSGIINSGPLNLLKDLIAVDYPAITELAYDITMPGFHAVPQIGTDDSEILFIDYVTAEDSWQSGNIGDELPPDDNTHKIWHRIKSLPTGFTYPYQFSQWMHFDGASGKTILVTDPHSTPGRMIVDKWWNGPQNPDVLDQGVIIYDLNHDQYEGQAIAVWNENECEWQAIELDSEGAIYVEVTDPVGVYPGLADVECTICEWNDPLWLPTGGTLLVSDPLFRNCILPGERARAKFNSESDRWEFPGSQGLLRQTIVYDDVFAPGEFRLLEFLDSNQVTTNIRFEAENQTTKTWAKGAFCHVEYTGANAVDESGWKARIVGSATNQFVLAKEIIMPGTVDGECELLEWDDGIGEYVLSGDELLVSDPMFRNCLLYGEQAQVYFNDETVRWEFVGSQGLLRQVKTYDAFTPGATLLVQFVDHDQNIIGATFDAENQTLSKIPEDAFCHVEWLMPPMDANKWAIRLRTPRSILFEVTMTKTGGSQGTTAAKPTYTYTVKDIAGVTLGTAVNPTASPSVCVRHIGHMTEATSGIATYDATTNGLKILSCNEQSITEACEAP